MSGGGGGGGNYQPQDNSLQVEAMRQQAAREERARLDAKEAADLARFNQELADAVSGARTTGTNYLGQRGLSTDQYGSVIDQIINDARLKVPKLDPNPGQYFGTDMFASGLDNYQNVQRGNYSGKVSSTFTPGFESTYIPDTADDAIIDEIINSQRGQAQQQVDFQRKRGLLNDAGYNTAQQKLGEQGQAARSTVSSVGSGVLGDLRGDLTDIVANAGSAASGWMLGQPTFDVEPYRQKVQTKAQEGLSDLGGRVRSALGDTQLFDIPSIIAAAGITQGPQNLTTAEAAPGIPFSQKKNNANRGLGSTGGF